MVDSPPVPITPRPALLSTLGILAPVLWGPAALASLPFLMMSAMIFDAPGSEESAFTLGLFYSLLSFPFLAVLSAVATPIITFCSKTAHGVRSRRSVMAMSIALCALPLASLAGVASFVALLMIFCGGNFAC